MQFITDAVPLYKRGWRIATVTTAQASLHAIYMQTDDVICLGVETAPDEMPTSANLETILSALEAQKALGSFQGDYGVISAPVARFDALGHLSGDLPRFANGWANETGLRVSHVFPCFRCELSSAWPAVKFAAAVRSIRNLFNLAREPNPFIEITMEGRAFTRPVTKWANAPLSVVLSYAPALADDPTGVLKIRNIDGVVLVLDAQTGWSSYAEVITDHVRLSH